MASLAANPHADNLPTLGTALGLTFNLQFGPWTDRHHSILGPRLQRRRDIDENVIGAESLAGAVVTRKPVAAVFQTIQLGRNILSAKKLRSVAFGQQRSGQFLQKEQPAGLNGHECRWNPWRHLVTQSHPER